MTRSTHSPVAAVLVAAGRGERAGKSKEGPKQYRLLGGRSVLARSLETFANHPRVGKIVLVIHPDDEKLCRDAIGSLAPRPVVVTGGATRQSSTLQGLLALTPEPPQTVLIHDVVRPFVEAELIDRVIDAASTGAGALPALPVSDTLKRTDAAGQLAGTLDRDHLYAAQTPQGFPFAAILAAHQRAASEMAHDFTDDAAIAEWAGIPVTIVAGSPSNIKLTWARDLAMAEALYTSSATFPDTRIGNGYDVHAFAPGDHVTLCGVDIPFDRRLSGHSDADVALHALTDALLGTLGAGDIGTHFPPSDPQWKGVASRVFVDHALRLVRARGGRIGNIDITLICEAPKIGPYRDRMTMSLARLLGIARERVSVKATTNEKLGFVGRGEGIAGLAAVSVTYPGDIPL